MNNHHIKQELPDNAVALSPKLHLVKGVGKSSSNLETSQPNDISEHVGFSCPEELTPSSSETTSSEKSPEHLQAIEDVNQYDAGLITATELRKLHLKTYKNWDDMKQRCKVDPETGIRRIALDQSFEKFADFLRILGPRPEQSMSVDRIDHTGPYTPDNVRWASKTTQTRNRSNTVKLTYRGKTQPLVEWAEELEINPATLRGRKSSGWTDEEAIEGKRSWATSSPSPPLSSQKHWEFTPWHPKNREAMERLYQSHGGGEHRLRFAKRYSEWRISRIMEQIDKCSWPDYYTPGDAEHSRLEELTRQHDIWESIRRYNDLKWSKELRTMPYRKYELPAWVEKKLSAGLSPALLLA